MSDSIGTTVDADLASIKAYLAALEAKAIADEKALTTWFKNNALHLANAGGIIAALLKLFGKL